MNLFQRIRSWLDYPPRVDQNGDAVRTTAPEIEPERDRVTLTWAGLLEVAMP